MPTVTCIIPMYNEVHTIKPLCESIGIVLQEAGYSYEILIVDDGSTDGSTEVARALAQGDDAVTTVELRGNFGKSAALAAGIDHAQGEILITMDADLQDDPTELPRFIRKLDEGYDVVSGYKKTRHDPPGKVLPSRIFNRMVRLFTGVKLNDINCGFKAYRREVFEAISIYGEMHRLIPVLATWRRFKVAEIEVRHHPRRHGVSKFGPLRMVRGFMDLLTVSFLMRYSQSPAYFFGAGGLLLLLLGIVICSYLTVLWFMGLGPIGNRPLLFLGILLILVGLQGFLHGLTAEMNSFLLQKNQPLYSIRTIHGQHAHDAENHDQR